MASKGWGLFLVMLSILVSVLVVGSTDHHAKLVVQVSPQGSAVILSSDTRATTGDGVSRVLKDTPQFKLWPKTDDRSAIPLFRLPPYVDVETSDFATQEGPNCSLYH